MAGIGPTGSVGVGIAGARIDAQLQVAAVKRVNDAAKLQGNLALQLIQSATSADPDVGANLNVSV